MKYLVHHANQRGITSNEWLTSCHSFNFGNYFDVKRSNFGDIRVLNDDIIKPKSGFPEHNHQNIEIISIVLSGELTHSDSGGNKNILKAGGVQVISAGSGIYHSEHNNSAHEEVNFLQIWLRPQKVNTKPRYQCKQFTKEEGKMYKLASFEEDNNALHINQKASINLGTFSLGERFNLRGFNIDDGIYILLLEGNIEIEGKQDKVAIGKKDAVGIWDIGYLEDVHITTITKSEILIIKTILKRVSITNPMNIDIKEQDIQLKI